jgi:hypothetical protein
MISNLDPNNMVSFRGDDLGINLEFKDTDDVPIDITGWTIFLTLKRSRDQVDADAIVEMNVTNIPSPELGVVLITVPNTVTINFSGSYWYDIQIKKTDGTIQTITNGNIFFERDVTRRTT